MRLMAALVAPRSFTDVDGFDLRAVCGPEALARTATHLLLDDDSALFDGCADLSGAFELFPLWCAPSADAGGPGGAPCDQGVLVRGEDSATMEVVCTAAGTCAAVEFWWEGLDPCCRSAVRAAQWLRAPLVVEIGQRVVVTATRTLSQVRIAIAVARAPDTEGEVATTGAHAALGGDVCQPNFAALRHCPMLRDDARNGAYAGAIRRAVSRAQKASGEASVFEIGSGTGLLLLMAARAGAEHIVGCEVDSSMCDLARRVAADNAVPLGVPGERIELLPESFVATLQDASRHRQSNVLMAELLDDTGLGEQIWPFFALARQHLVASGAGTTVVPRKLTLFAVLLAAETAPVCGVDLWPLDPFWFCSAVPNLDAVGRRPGAAHLDLDALEAHWAPASGVAEVLSVDLASVGLDSVKEQELDVSFEVVREGIINGIAWFWHAELDDECTLVTTPTRFWNRHGHVVPATAVRGSRRCWKQAAQAFGPVWAQPGERVAARLRHNTIAMHWAFPSPQQGPEADAERRMLPLFADLE
eukprot:CAMPEP_0198568252 /NCGR_PEP_ID=MMETSP1462-20131121/106130_1 /TAXON_ID=1333877 /ORGANISM="Brandtodinium nutriculum, Strain RCC3387" /LENGTH=529 /DNA_ID=CAMNT_0044299321 /DNA_START=23 /DNA_END=1609 /DNA_ORIENTATION=+